MWAAHMWAAHMWAAHMWAADVWAADVLVADMWAADMWAADMWAADMRDIETESSWYVRFSNKIVHTSVLVVGTLRTQSVTSLGIDEVATLSISRGIDKVANLSNLAGD